MIELFFQLQNVYICEDPTCDNTERAVPLQLINGYPACNKCRQGLMCKDYSDSQLYRQLTYLKFLFDVNKHFEDLNETEKGNLN